MVDPISSSIAAYPGLRMGNGLEGIQPGQITGPQQAGEISLSGPGKTESDGFSNILGDLVRAVDEKGQVAEKEVKRLMLGESDNIHRSVIAMQEAGVAFSLLVEVRNKLVESYQELMRMPV